MCTSHYNPPGTPPQPVPPPPPDAHQLAPILNTSSPRGMQGLLMGYAGQPPATPMTALPGNPTLASLLPPGFNNPPGPQVPMYRPMVTLMPGTNAQGLPIPGGSTHR